ncbi:MAG: hypothetical protein KF698_07610 [Anaerolineales bacterium]|nr:hypothetical protein [Anaerolineales bacterium]
MGKRSPSAPTLQALLYYQLVCAQPTRSGRRSAPSMETFLRRSLRQFRTEHPDHASLLAQRFLEQVTAKEVALQQAISPETVNRNQQRAIQVFADWLLAQEHEARLQRQAELLACLPPASFAELVGAKPMQAKLHRLLTSQQLPWVICLTGIGGIGKTSLANQAVRSLLPDSDYNRVLWLQAAEGQAFSQQSLLNALSKQLLPATLPASERLPALQLALKNEPTLIVLDDVDSELADPAWVDWLHALAQPSRFLLCSRQRPAALARAYVLTLSELPAKAALELMSLQAREVGLEASLPLIRKHAAALYARTGGNPLALKLAVGLLHSWPISAVLDALHERTHADIDAVYTAIYQASWQALNQPGRRLLLAMPLVGSQGASLAQLRAISGLSAAALRNAVHELHQRSLLEASGDAEHKRYAIHALTRSFLRTQILNES